MYKKSREVIKMCVFDAMRKKIIILKISMMRIKLKRLLLKLGKCLN